MVKVIPDSVTPGGIVCVVELSGLCNRSAKINAPPSKLSQALSSRVQRIIDSYICPDSSEQLKIFSASDSSRPSFHVASYLLHLDIIVLQNDGCLLDACLPVALGCLHNAKWPKLEGISNASKGCSSFLQFTPSLPLSTVRLNLSDWPLAVSFGIVPVFSLEENSEKQDQVPFIAQPSARELSMWDTDAGLITIVINSAGFICDSDILFSFLSSVWRRLASRSVIRDQNQLITLLLSSAIDQAKCIRSHIQNVLQ
ncbi:unnamed protein product [Protopolystoma xenopodis]|uniref:Uncharacterized protein n=1 Tax=Protopolystoma xenopodis TaxID=117903 RepID=A0A448X303_9PLAT|nr:unnamed protein product [Protopolystoma xenopodis]